jgi:cytochrome c-type biogenesis protein CcmE
MTDRNRLRKRAWSVLAIAIGVGALLFITVGGIGENLVYYWAPSDIVNAGDKAVGATIRLGGQVVPGSIRQQGTSSLEFDVTDTRANVHVKANSVPPQMFREGIGVVIEGTMNKAGYFEGNRLMVSHDNQYKAPEDHAKSDVKDLMKSTEGLQE